MRLWSISPEYLDTKGLLALWRETLLAKKVLEGKTKGYKNHPQLIRFKKTCNPHLYLNLYLYQIYFEAVKRGFNFDKNKIDFDKISNLNISNINKIKVSYGQVKYEYEFLMSKLKKRDFKKYTENKNTNIGNIDKIEVNPIFEIVEGDIEKWEKVKDFRDI